MYKVLFCLFHQGSTWKFSQGKPPVAMAQTTASFASCRRMRHAIKSDYGHHIMEDMMALQSLSNQQSINQNWVFHATACLHHDEAAVFNPNETQYCWHRTIPSHQLISCWLVVVFARLWRASMSCNCCNCTPKRDVFLVCALRTTTSQEVMAHLEAEPVKRFKI